MHKKVKDGEYCFQHWWNENTKSYQMVHTYTCLSPKDDTAWENIDSANFFDIKLAKENDVSVYMDVIEKIKEISKTKFCFIHFSNVSTEVLGEKQKELFWKLMEILDEGQDFGLEFQHKPTRRCRVEFDKYFFDLILKKYKHLKYIKLSLFDDRLDNDMVYYFK